MSQDQQMPTMAELEKLISEKPDDLELKADLAWCLIDEIGFSSDGQLKEGIRKSALFNRLTSIAREIAEKKPDWRFENAYFQSNIAFINDDLDLFRANIVEFIKFLPDETPFDNDALYDFFLAPFDPPFEGMYKLIGDGFNQKWPDCTAAMLMFGLEARQYDRDEDKALDFFSLALEKDEKAWLAAYNIGAIYQTTKIWKSAIRFYKKCVELDPHPSPQTYFNLAWCYGKERAYQLEEEAYRKCLDIDPDYSNARNNLGWCLLRQKRFDEALEVFDASIKRGKDGNYPYRNKVDVLKKMGRYGDAVEFIMESISRKKLGKSYLKEIDKLQEMITRRPSLSGEEPEVNEKQEETHIAETPNRMGGEKRELSKEWMLEQEFETKILRNDLVFGRRLKMYETESAYGRQFIIPGIGRLDILAQEVGSNDYYIIELKKGIGDDQVIGQIARYMGWVKQNLVRNDEKVHGIVCVNQVTEKLKLSAQVIPNIYVYEYGVHTRLIT